MQSEVRRWPLDFDSLSKGDNIDPEKIEEAYNVVRDTNEYALKKLSLAKQIEDELLNRNIQATVRSNGAGLRILTDAEASEYNLSESEKAIKKLGRCTRRISGVDNTDFTDDEKRVHEHRCMIVSKVYLSAKKARNDVMRLLPHTRTTPSMVTIKEPSDA